MFLSIIVAVVIQDLLPTFNPFCFFLRHKVSVVFFTVAILNGIYF